MNKQNLRTISIQSDLKVVKNNLVVTQLRWKLWVISAGQLLLEPRTEPMHRSLAFALNNMAANVIRASPSNF